MLHRHLPELLLSHTLRALSLGGAGVLMAALLGACVGDSVTQPPVDGGGGDGGADVVVGTDATDSAVDAGPPAASGGHLWLKTLGGTGASGIATDASGNSYVVGSFSGTQVDFEKTKLSSAGAEDIYVLKLDPKGAVIWAVSFGGTSSDLSEGVAVDEAGDVYVSGNFKSPTLTIGTTIAVATAGGKQGGFVAKIKGSDGSGLWAAVFGGGQTFNTHVSATTTVVAVATYFTGSTFASGKPALTAFGGGSDGAVLAFDSSGTPKWTTLFGSSAPDSISGVVVMPNGDVLVAGDFYGTPLMNSADVTKVWAKKGGYADGFVARLSLGEGKPIWGNVWASSSTGNVFPGVLALSGNALAVGGAFYNGADLGVGGLTPSLGESDAFITRFDVGSQSTTWAKSVGGNDTDGSFGEVTNGVAFDAWGELISVGVTTTSDCKTDGTTIPGPSATNRGLWAVKHSPSGSVLWAKGIPATTGGVVPTGVAITPNGEIRIAGYLNGSAKLDRASTFTANGLAQMFVLGWSP